MKMSDSIGVSNQGRAHTKPAESMQVGETCIAASRSQVNRQRLEAGIQTTCWVCAQRCPQCDQAMATGGRAGGLVSGVWRGVMGRYLQSSGTAGQFAVRPRRICSRTVDDGR